MLSLCIGVHGYLFAIVIFSANKNLSRHMYTNFALPQCQLNLTKTKKCVYYTHILYMNVYVTVLSLLFSIVVYSVHCIHS